MKKLLISVMAVAMVTMCVACGDKPAEPTEPVEETPVVEQEVEEPQEEPEEEIQKQPEEPKDEQIQDEVSTPIGIKGSFGYDIPLNLEEILQMPRGSFTPCEDKTMCDKSAFAQMAYGDGDITYNIFTDKNEQIILLDVSITSASGSNAFLTEAKDFLGFCATMAYDTSDIEQSKTFVINSIDDLSTKENNITIGDADMRISKSFLDNGACTAINLEVYPHVEQ